MLVVNNNKNPAHGARPFWRNIAKLVRRRVLVVITARTRAGGYVLLLGIGSSCILAPENHMDVLKTRCEEQARCNSPLYLDRGVGVCFGKAAIVRPGAPPTGRHESLIFFLFLLFVLFVLFLVYFVFVRFRLFSFFILLRLCFVLFQFPFVFRFVWFSFIFV